MKSFLSRLLILSALLPLSSQAQDWTRFRGPNGTGISEARTIPTQWSKSDFNWKAELPSQGHSSPVIWGDKIFLTSERAGEPGTVIYAMSTDGGRMLWQHEFEFGSFRKHKYNSFASSTPTVDKDRVYVMWMTPEEFNVTAFTHSGEKVWQQGFGSYSSQHGLGSSPILFDGKLIIPNEQLGDSFILALDPATGKTLWKCPRTISNQTAYSTPVIYTPASGKPMLIANSRAHGIAGIDPSTGKALWDYPDAFNKRSCSSPVIAGDVILGTCGSGGGGRYIVAVKPGDSTGAKASLAWKFTRNSQSPYVPTSIYRDGYIYIINDDGFGTCLEAKSGKEIWSERLNARFFGSPVWVDGRLFAGSTTGEVVVLAASPEFKELARNDLGENIQSTPAISDGVMYVRTSNHLYSIGGKK